MAVYKSINTFDSTKNRLESIAGNTSPIPSLPSDEGEEKKNRGGIVGGALYLDQKMREGLLSSIEGITDFTIGSIAKLFGFDKFAERQFANSWSDKALYNPIEKGVGKLLFGDSFGDSDEWFNPGKGWKVAGDVAGGIGTSLPAMAAALGVTLATGGAGAGVGATLLAKAGVVGASFATAGLGAAGNATTEAYSETGQLTGKELGYGALTGALEGGMEGITNLIGLGGGAVIKSVGKALGKEVAESAVRSGIGITLAKSFAGEAFEEGVAEIVSGQFKRWTYDENAENATAGEVLYASVIGGLSGVVMGGAGSVYSTARNTARGTQIVEKGQTEQVLGLAKAISEKTEAEKLGDLKQYKQVEATYKKLTESLAKTNGEVRTVAQRRMLGELEIDNIAAVVTPKMLNTATNVVNHVDLIADVYSFVDENGNTVNYTKEQLLEGIDLNDLRGTIPTALETNAALRNVVMSSMTSELLMDTSAFQQAVLDGKKFAGEADLENFLKAAESQPEMIKAVERELGVDLRTVDEATFNQKVAAYKASGKLDERYVQYKAQKTASTGESAPLQASADTNDASALSTATDTAQASIENANNSLISTNENITADKSGTYVNFSNEELENNALSVLKMEPVAQLTGKEFSDDGTGTLKDKVVTFFRSFGNKVDTIEIGAVSVTQSTFRDDKGHGLTRNKVISFQAIPEVLKTGRVIDVYTPEGKPYDRITIAAPITIGTDKYYMGVMVQKDNQSNRAYLHDVITEKATLSFNTEPTAQESEGIRDKGHLYITSILENALKVKEISKKSIDNGDKVAAFAESGKLYEYASRANQSSQNISKPIDNDSGMRYAKPKAKYISYSAIGKSQVENVRTKLKQLYSDIDSGVATEIAIEDGDTVYIVDSGKENGKIDFGFRKKLTITDDDIRSERIRSINNDAVSKGNVSDSLSSKVQTERNNDNRSRSGLKAGTELSADKGQSQDNEGRISQDNGDRGRLTSNNDTVKSSKSMTVLESIKFAQENVTEYAKLDAEGQARIRRLIRQAKANGFTDAQARAYARVAARSGIDIVIGKEGLYLGKDQKTGEDVYADGLYSPKRNKIYVNPEGTRSPARLLIHELTHAIYKGKGRLILERGAKNLTKEQKEAIWNKYFPDTEFDESNIIFKDELNAHYTEAMLDDDVLLQKLCDENPTLEDKIINFLTGAKKAYADEPTLSREAKKLYKRYKTLFDSFAERNQYADTKRQGEERYALIGRTEDGRGIYRTNYPENTPKDVKQKDIVYLVQNVWSKKPIKLNLVVDGKEIPIEARFNPELTERSDLSKIAFGNRKGTASEKRITMNLSSDLYQIAEESHHVGSKTESGKDNATHAGVTTWHYFLTDLVYVEADGTKIECYMNIDVKQNDSGHWFYSFAIEKGSRPADVLSVVTDKSATTSTNSITKNNEKSNPSARNFSKKVSTNSGDRMALPDGIDLDNDGGERYNYSEEQYNSFGWARANDAISSNELDDLYSKIQAKSSLRIFKQSSKGEAIIEVNNDPHSTLGVDNVFVFVKGKKDNFNITRVVRFDAQTETEMEIYKEALYEGRTCSDTYLAFLEEQEVTREYRIENYKSFAEYQKSRGDGKTSRGANRDNRKPKKYGSGYSLTVGENGEIIEKFASDRYALPDTDEVMNYKSIFGDVEMVDFDKKYYKNKAEFLKAERDNYKNEAEFWKAERDNIKGRDRLLGLLMSKAQRMKDLKLGTFSNSTQFDSELFKGSIEKLARVQFRGNLNVSGTRKIMGELLQWYRKDNPVLEYVDDSNTGLYVQGVADMLESLSEGEKGFSKEELSTMYDVMSYFVKFVENYGKVFRKGKMVEALPEAKRYIGIMNENEELNEKIKVGFFTKLSGSWYAEMFNDPAALVRRMDYYENGFYTEMFEELRNAATDAEIAEMEVLRKYDNFLRDNKRYMESASAEVVEYRGTKITKIKLIDLYMTMKRKHAWAGIALNGFAFNNLDGKAVRMPGFISDTQITEADLEAAISAQRTEIAKHFNDADRKYMSILEEVYNVDARKLKADRDIQRLGFTNATTDYYYPIRRAYTSQNIDTSDAQAEYDRVTNSSFNKDIVKGAKQELAIESADTRFRRHIHAVCQYAYLSPAVETFNRLYNMDTSDNKNRPVSIRTASENTWTKGRNYFKKLISDIQGIPTSSSEGMAALSFIRGNYAKFQLGANPKVWFTQMSSIFASSSILDADCISKGIALSAEGVDKYCPLAELRSYDNTAAMAQGVIDRQGKSLSKTGKATSKVSKFSDLLMIPIGKMDRFVVCRLFGACQAQIEKNGGAKVGTEANKIEAGKLLKRVMLETQQNSIATERSAAMRSGNEILRTMTMFTSDSMKVIGRVIDAFGEISVLRAKIKAGTESKSVLEARLKTAKKNARKATTALVTSAIFMASIAQLFRWIYDKEQEEDETIVETMTVDAVGNLFGGLPIIKDVYARIFDGYGFDNYAYSSVNDLLDSAIGLIDTSGKIISGEATSQDVASGIKNLSYSVGQMTGLPIRNVYNVLYGLTKRFSPETAYKIDGAFYKKNYQTDLYKAIERDDAEMASFILELLYNERTDASICEAVHNELFYLSTKGHKVIPKAAPDVVSIDGETYELNETQKQLVRKSYSESSLSIEKLIAKNEYKKMNDDAKAEAINYVYSIYYNSSIEEALGANKGKVVLISSIIGAENLALLNMATKGITSDTDKKGNVISGSKRKKVIAAINALNISNEQKALLICSKGYSLQTGDIRGLSAEAAKRRLLNYILKLSISKEKRIQLAEMCGFAVKNGKIILKK